MWGAFGAGRSSTALPTRFEERAPGSLHFLGEAGSRETIHFGIRRRLWRVLANPQTTNLGVGGSNPSGRAKKFSYLAGARGNRGKFLGNLVGLGWHGSDKFGERWDWGAW